MAQRPSVARGQAAPNAGEENKEATQEVEPPPPVDEELVMLQKKADAVNAEAIKLKQMLDVLVNVQSQNVREAKIIELLKKNAVLARHLDRERSLVPRLRKDVAILQQELAKLKEEEIRKAAEGHVEKETGRSQQEGHYWKDKYHQTTAKLMEVQGARSVLTAEIARVQHALQREVGNVPVAKVLEEGQHWKGRAQTISLLKDKVAELEAKVRERAQEDQNRDFNAKENTCKKQLDELANNFLATKDELIKIKKKVDCVIARRNILETEMNNAKEKMALLMAKSDSDDRLILALRQEVQASKQTVAPDRLKERISCPLRVGSLHREHLLAASFNDLKLHCREQEVQIKAQAELLQYLTDITASARGEEEKHEAAE